MPRQASRLSPPVDKERRHRLRALCLRQSCPGLPPVDTLVSVLRGIQNRLLRHGADLEAPCTDRNTERCWILRGTTALNEVLRYAQLEVKELEPRVMAVCCVDTSLLTTSAGRRVLEGYLLLHYLLQRHPCIRVAQLSSSRTAEPYSTVEGDALARNTGLSHLSVAFRFVSKEAQRTLAGALCKMTRIETLCIDGLAVEPEPAARLADTLARVPKLRVVELVRTEMDTSAADVLSSGICNNAKLRVFKLSESLLGDSGAVAIGNMLGNGSSELEELSLKKIENFSEAQAMSIIRPLAVNHRLRTLVLERCCLTPVTSTALVNAVSRNCTLTTLSIVDCEVGHGIARAIASLIETNTSLQDINLKDNCLGNMTAMALARSLVFNRTLRRLNLKRNNITVEGAILLVDALASNETLTELTLGHVGTDPDSRLDLSRPLRHAAVNDRVRFSYVSDGVSALSWSLGSHGTRITSVQLKSHFNIKRSCLKELFEALRSAQSLETLDVEVQTRIDDSAARRLSRLLSTTTTLKKVRLDCGNTQSEALAIVMRGLQVNRSVTHFEVPCALKRPRIRRALWEMLSTNTCLTHFGTIEATNEQLEFTASGMAGNRVLVSFQVWETAENEPAMFEVRQVLRRNLCLLNRAVEFAMDPHSFGTQRSPAEAYEELCHTDSFAALIEKTAGAGALKRLMLNARRYITGNLLAITGVSQGPVTCFLARRRSRTQIDSLNFECWLEICSFLRVRDIEVPTACRRDEGQC